MKKGTIMKYYAVKNGRTPGVYRTWEDAKKQVDGFSGAEYKSFEKITDATEYLDWNKETQPDIVKEDSLSNAIKKLSQLVEHLKLTLRLRLTILPLFTLMEDLEILVFIKAVMLMRPIKQLGLI